MMFSMDKCTGRGSTGISEESELFAGGGEGLGKENVPSDEVASAVAAVSDEIGDILKDELGDADRADRIGAELADLSAELGLLAGLADEPQQDFPSLFDLAMGHRGSGSGSSSSSWSGGRGRQRRHSRPQRAPRRRPIAKGKEMCVRRGATSRRAVTAARRVQVVSDASDVGADSDSDDQWTELDDASGSSDSSSSLKEAAAVGVDCNGYQHKESAAEPPAMGQFLLPLLSSDPAAPDPEHFLIRHEDILQLLASAEESVRDDLAPEQSNLPHADILNDDTCEYEEHPVTAEEQAMLLHYVCEAEREACQNSVLRFVPVEEWLLGVYHSWCEISALMYTLIGTNMSVEMVTEEWVYRARFGCHCRLCLCLANSGPALAALVRDIVWALAHDGKASATAAKVMRALGLGAGKPTDPDNWDMLRLQHVLEDQLGAAIIHEQMVRLTGESDIASQIINKICMCRQFDKPLEEQYAVERFIKILENFKAASTITFKVEMVPAGGEGVAGDADGSGGCGVTSREWVGRARARLARYLAPHQRASTSARLRDMAARTTPHDLNAWSGYKHRCDCLTPRTLCAQQRKQLLRISFFGMMQAVNEFNGPKPEPQASLDAAGKAPNNPEPETTGRELQQGDGTGAKPPDSMEGQPATEPVPVRIIDNNSDSNPTGDFDYITDSDANSGTPSIGMSTSSSLDSASELLLAAAAAVDSGGSEGESAPGELCRTVRHLMRSIASIERLMDQVLKHCDDWPSPQTRNDHEASRKRVDMGLSEVDRKLMAMYRRLPEVHRRQLQVYRKQKKLSTVCMQLVGGRAPAPPPPGSPPPAPAPAPCRALCPEYHLQRFKEVRRKVMHMRDQQLYYHRLRMWLEDQLRHERESLPDSNVTLIEDLPRRKRRTASPKLPRLTTAAKRKLKPVSPSISKPHKILQMLKQKTPHRDDIKNDNEAEPPEAFPLEREDNISDTETIVGEKETGDLCKDMKECLAKFANFALNSPDNNLQQEYEMQTESEVKYPDSVSPPLQEMSPTTSEPMPVYTPKGNQRLLSVKKFLNRSVKKDDRIIDFHLHITPEVLNVPLNARRTPILIKEESEKDLKMTEIANDTDIVEKDPNVYKYVTFGLEIKKAMEECQNIINSYNSIKDKDGKEREVDPQDGPLSLEQICEVMMSLDKNSAEFLESDEPMDINTVNTKLAEIVENMPQILANMPEIASKLSEFANASFELPEFASIMNSLPDMNNEAQLTPETLKQIRELKLNKCRDNVKVTKNTTKRKTSRRIKNSIDTSDIIGTMTFEFDSKDITDLLKDEKEIQALMKNKSTNKEDFKDLLFSISAQVVINKVFEYLKQNKSPELAKCLEDDMISLPKNSINSEMYSKASTLFDNSVKDALSMDELRELVKSRFNSWKHYVASKFKSIPIELLENEIEAMLDKFYSYIQDLAGKQCVNDSDKIIEKIDELRQNSGEGSYADLEGSAASKESLKQITKLLSTSAGNTFDLLIMKLSILSPDKKTCVKSLKFNYMDIIRRFSESLQLAAWILVDPEVATGVIQELTGLPIKTLPNVPDFSGINNNAKKDYFIKRLHEMNRLYMDTLPKKALTGDEWLVMLYRLEQLEDKLKDAFSKVTPPPPKQTTQQNASEAEILAAKGLSKIIGKANVRVVKKSEPPKPVKKEEKVEKETKEKENERQCKNDALLAKCEAILTSKGEKSLLDSFYTIKSYITQGLPVPETYKKHVISICSSIDAKLLDEDLEDSLRSDDDETNKDKHPLSVIGSQNPEMLAKYSAQALRNAKQTLNAVAFRNLMRNGQTKSESDACDTPKTDCKWTNDCICNSCKDSENDSVCLGEIVKQCYDIDTKTKSGLEEKKKDVKQAKPVVKQAKPPAKACENTSHQQHVCKVGHSTNGTCAGEGGADQPCTCCYCTVFGHAPPLTTPVPRNFNETRERLRSILNKKKQQCKTNAVANQTEQETQEKKQAVQTQTNEPQPQPQPKVVNKPVTVAPKPPALPKTLPPNLTAAQALQKRQLLDNQQRQLADKMAKMVVTEKPEIKPKVLQRTVPVQVNVAPALKTEGKVNPNAMEQIRLQQLKQQQQAQFQQQQMQQAQQAAQKQQQQQQAAQQKKPEPIYDLPIHNKPALTPQQQQLQQQQQQQLQQQQLQQQQQQQIRQQQQLQQQQLQQQQQQQQLQQQQLQQQRQSRAQQQRTDSLSSRDTSVFSTSSGCSGGSCWRGSRLEDTRDLDALLQYIEGPARHVDRGKKRAKKQRQKAKKVESRLVSEISSLSAELSHARRAAAGLHAAHAAAARRVADTRQAIQQHQQGKKKGKKQKLNPAQQAKLQLVAEQLGELTTLLNTTAKEMQTADKQVIDCTRRLQHCERQLSEARSVQGKPERASVQMQQQAEKAALLQKHQQMQEQQHQHFLQQQQQQLQQLQQQQMQQQMHQQMQQQKLHQQKQLEQQRHREILVEIEKQKMEKQKQSFDNAHIVCVKRSPGDGAVTVSVPGQIDTPLAQLVHNNRHLTVLNVCEQPPPAQANKQSDSRKQTWEQALAHINQIAKGTTKEKKKQKEPPAKPEAKPKETQRSNSLPDPQTLSKKQRRALAKQQAEEEEKKKQQQETKSKKTETKKAEPVKTEVTKKVEKKVEVKKEPTVAKKKEEKKEKKQEKVVEKKGKENKLEKNVLPPAAKNKQPAQQQQNKKDKKKETPQKPQVVNITPDTTIEVVSKKNPCPNDAEKPTSCSIMEQLSCGVQVADLKLPPGITLTRVQPTEKKDPPTIKSVPLWKCSQLPASPTPVARPPPVINADPSMMMFTTAHPEPPKTILIPDPPPPQPTGKSKKAKKKAKKAASEAPAETKMDATKMVTLRNPMFHPNLPPVQITNTPQVQKKAEIRIPDPIPMPPNACQATITPTSNGMYTIRNPLMSMMHQQSMMGVRPQSPQVPMYQPPYNYMNPNVYQPAPNQYVIDPAPKPDEFQNRIMNLASFTQKNDEGYSLFKTNDDNNQKNFLTPEFYDAQSPKPVVSPNPIGTRPNNDSSRSFDSNDSSLFANPIQRPEPIGTPLKREEERNEYTGLYTPFGQEDRNVFRNALFSDKNDVGSNFGQMDDVGPNHISNGDSLPYFQRLRVGSKLNNEVTIHHVTESKFYKGQDGMPLEVPAGEESVFCRPHSVWPDPAYIPPAPLINNNAGAVAATTPRGSPAGSSNAGGALHAPCTASVPTLAPHGPVGDRLRHTYTEPSVFVPDCTMNLSFLEESEREIESFKRFDFYLEPPHHKPKVELDVRDIAAALRHNQN